MAKKEKRAAKKGNDRLVPRPTIVFGRDHGSAAVGAYVSSRTFSRQLFAAVLAGDVKAIERVYKDERVPATVAAQRYSHMDDRSPIRAALQIGNEKVIAALLKCDQARGLKKVADSVLAEPNLLQRKSVGRRNFRMIGRATRAIEAARGGREGNNAFLNYEPDEDQMNDGLLSRLDLGTVTYPFLAQWAAEKRKGGHEPLFQEGFVQGQFLRALRSGNRSLAYDLAQLQSHNFNQLQLESLKPNGKLPKPILAISVRKKSFVYRNVTPIHTAAINPDAAFLAALREVDPVINVPDQNNWYTMHYAAVCEGDGPLKYLISKDVGVCDVNKQGELPLHLAAKTGRVANVKVLLEAIAKMEKSEKDGESDEEEEDEDEPRAKRAKKARAGEAKKSIANAKTRKGRTALHYAIWHGRVEVVKLLLAAPAVDKEAANSANDKKLTPLMIAIGRGHLEIAELLIGAGALVEGKDKLKRSPLMIAAINGHANIAAMLLQMGADVNRKDTSGNTAMHYACAYGWMEIAKLIAKTDVAALATPNEWLITPLSIAYLKGHYGIVSWLLDEHSSAVDVNCKDNEGVTLISSLLSYHDAESAAHLPDQISYLIKHGADCSITDTDGNSPLHMFAAVPVVLKVDKPARTATGNEERITSAAYKKCVDQLIAAKADPLVANADGATPFKVALSAGNLYLATMLLDLYGQELLEGEGAAEGNWKPNVLHALLTVPQTVAGNSPLWAYADAPLGGQYNIVPTIKKLAAMAGKEQIEAMLAQPNDEGYTPVLQLCLYIATLDHTSVSQMEAGAFSGFSATVMAALRECLRLQPESVLDRRAVKEDAPAVPEADLLSVITLALQPGSNRRGKNLLLEALLSCAAEFDNLHAFLTQKIATEEAKCPVTPLVKTLLKRQEMEAILILRAAKDAGIGEEVCGAVIETRPKSGGEEEGEKGASTTAGWRPPNPAALMFPGGPPMFGNPFAGKAARRSVNARPNAAGEPKKTPEAEESEPWNKAAFHIAIQHALLKALPHFQLSNAQAAAVDASGRNAWHYAANSLTPHTIQLFELLEAKRVPMVANEYGQTPLHVAVNAEKTGSADAFLDPIEWLLERSDEGETDAEGRTALHYAFEKRSVRAKAKELRKQDPIAVVSLLINRMSGKTIRQADAAGCTALHLAARADANICVVSLLAKGSEVDAKNADGNSPLALALLAKSQAAALTLIQAHADISGPVLGPEPEPPKEKLYRYLGTPVPRPERLRSAIPDVVVRNEWHSLVYVMLDLLGKTPETISKLVAAALRNGQHNFAIYLLKLLGRPTPEVQQALTQHDFLSLYTESLVGAGVAPAATVLERILELKVPFIDAAGRSPVIEKAARKGHYQLLDRLVTADPARFATLAPHASGTSPVEALLQRWLVSGQSERATIRYWILRFTAYPGLDIETGIAVPVRALPGCRDAMAETGTSSVGCVITPLVAAIRAQDAELVKFLVVECRADANKASPLLPIAEAVITNNPAVVKALIDGELEGPTAPAFGAPAKAAKAPRRAIFGVSSPQMKNMTNGLRGGERKQLGAIPPSPADSSSEEEEEEDEEQERDTATDEDDPMGEEGEEEEAAATPAAARGGRPLDLKGSRVPAIDVTGRDPITGRNLAHYLVDPAGWQNVPLLEALVRLYKAKMTKLLTLEDNQRETPIALAARHNQHAMHAAMIKHATAPTSDDVAGLQIVVPPATACDVKGDSESLLKEFAATALKNKEDTTTSRVPNKKSGYEKTGEIVECAETSQLCQVLLNRTDLRGGLYGFHNYYKMELIKRRDADLFLLFTNWGRIGDAHGEFQCTPFNSLDAGMKEFRTVFKQKTGQEWLPLADFAEKQGKYRLTKTEDSVRTAADVDVENFKLERADEDVPEMRFISDIGNVKQLRRYAHSVQLSNHSTVACPFGRVAKEEIERARGILDRLETNLDAMERAREKRPPSMDEVFRLTDEQYLLTSSFYTTVPVGGYEHSSLRVISSHEELRSARAILDQIGEIEVAGRLVSAAKYAKTKRGEDPLRYLLSALDCSISLQPPASPLSQRVLQWIAASASNVDVRAIYAVNTRRAAQAALKHADCANLTYLFHGTKAENMLSILHYGLKATPSNSLQCGQAFGNGVYFADVFEKSSGYCGQSAAGLNYMLVCKVALGTVLIKDELEKKDRFDTRKVQGAKEPVGGITIDGAMMPLGPLAEVPVADDDPHRWWRPPYNEYVVKDEARILPALVIAFKN